MTEQNKTENILKKTFFGKHGTDAVAASALLLFFIAAYIYFAAPSHILPAAPVDSFAAGTSKDVPVYVIDEKEDEKTASESKTIVRGSGILKYSDEVTLEDETYIRIEEKGNADSDGAAGDAEANAGQEEDGQPAALYMKPENIAESRNHGGLCNP